MVGQLIKKVVVSLLVSMTVAIPVKAESVGIDAQALFMTAQLESDRLSATDLIQNYLKTAFEQAQQDANLRLSADIGIMLSAQYRAIGMNRDALQVLKAIHPKACTSDACSAALAHEFALCYRANGDMSKALVSLSDALYAAGNMQNHDMQAVLLNEKGTLSALQGELSLAVEYLDQALQLNSHDVAIILNRIRLAVWSGDHQAVETYLPRAEVEISKLMDNRQSVNSHLNFGILLRDAQKRLALPASIRLKAFAQFEVARKMAQTLQATRLESFATGYIGGLYEDERRFDEALQYSRRAAFLAQSVNADESLYLWQWQGARIFNEQENFDEATIAYRQSIETLGRLKIDLNNGSSVSFRERAAPVFFSFADLLLTRTASLDDPEAVEDNLREIRTTLEQVKIAEVQEYFGDQCMGSDNSSMELDRIASSSAIIYPILLADRTELLVSLPGGLQQFTSPVSARQLTAEVREFRRGIESYDGRQDYLRQAQRLYQWLIAPLEPALAQAGISTLVIVPDGPLRTIPLSALHDGNSFLIERYAMATTPGLTLTSPRPLEREQVQLLAGGLTKGVQGFSALPNVGSELDSISKEFPSQTIRDEAFVIDEVQRQIADGDQAIVHIATHGQFDSDHTKSFLLAYDDKLTMDKLQSTIASRQFQQEPLELLVLSACQTAAGDDRAALGLAGVALNAGARSALATLWFVNDESTSRMITDFYRQLSTSSSSKAEALQKAQLALIRDPRFSHPSFWAPFLLIGNWL